MKELKRYIKIYPHLLSQAIKSKLAYKADAIIGILGFMIGNVVTFLTLYLTISSIPSFGDWTIDKMIFLYGFCLIPKSIDHIFTDSIWAIGGWQIKNGELDKSLVRPINPLFFIIATEFQAEGIGELILGIVFLCVSTGKQPIIWSLNNIVPLIICGFFSIFLFTAIKLIFASLAFWVKRSISIMNTIYGFSDFTKYPIDIFGKFVKVILVYIIPFSLTMYYPVAYLYSDKSIWPLTLQVIIVVVLFVSFSYFLWLRGLKRYESAGN